MFDLIRIVNFMFIKSVRQRLTSSPQRKVCMLMKVKKKKKMDGPLGRLLCFHLHAIISKGHVVFAVFPPCVAPKSRMVLCFWKALSFFSFLFTFFWLHDKGDMPTN